VNVLTKISDSFTFKLWGFSTCRMVVILDVLDFLYLITAFTFFADHGLPDPDHAKIYAHLGVASWVMVLALFFCFLPPFNKTKLYFCWPLTGLLIIVLMLVSPL
jgi:hypothetical protein